MKIRTFILLGLAFNTLFAFTQVPDWQWASQAGGSSHNHGYAISTDDAGNSYMTGSFGETATFGSYSLNSNGNKDIFVGKLNVNGNWQWVTQAGGSDNDYGYAIEIDDTGNSYVSGSFQGTAYFGTYSITSNGNDDIFVSKIDANGNWQWAIQAGGSNNDSGYSIAIDTIGNSYVTGYFIDTATFGSYSLNSSGYNDIFVSKIDANGNWLWVTKAGGTLDDYGRAIAIDNADNCYVAGYFKGIATFGSYSLSSSGDSYDIFVSKIDTNGNWQWATKAGGIDYDFGYSIAIDNGVNSYVSGSFQGIATFGSYSITSSGGYGFFVAKMDSNGNWIWVTKAGGSSSENGNGITIDDAGNTYVTGYFQGTANFGSYSLTSSDYNDIFVAKIDVNGNWQWATQAGGTLYDYGRAISLDNAGNSYVSGSFYSTATFGTYSLTSIDHCDIFVAKLENFITAYFNANHTSDYLPFDVNFTDQSTGIITSWEWDFQNDGTIDSYEQNPAWT